MPQLKAYIMTILNNRKLAPPTRAIDIIRKTDFATDQAEYDEYKEHHDRK